MLLKEDDFLLRRTSLSGEAFERNSFNNDGNDDNGDDDNINSTG